MRGENQREREIERRGRGEQLIQCTNIMYSEEPCYGFLDETERETDRHTDRQTEYKHD